MNYLSSIPNYLSSIPWLIYSTKAMEYCANVDLATCGYRLGMAHGCGLGMTTGVTGTLLAVGLARKIQQYRNAKPPIDQKALTHLKVQDAFKEFGITEWSLPGYSTNKNNAKNKIVPIFDEDTEKKIQSLRDQIENATPESPLPHLIFTGRPGVGKTSLALELCTKNEDVGFIALPVGAMNINFQKGNHLEVIQKIKEFVQEYNKPVYLLLDEGDEYLRQRPETVDESPKDNAIKKVNAIIEDRKNSFLGELLRATGTEGQRTLGFVVTTNLIGVIDKGWINRSTVVRLDPPNHEERKQIIIAHIEKIFENKPDVVTFFNKGYLEKMAKYTEGFTGRNISKMLTQLSIAVSQSKKDNITKDLVKMAISEVAKSVTDDVKTKLTGKTKMKSGS